MGELDQTAAERRFLARNPMGLEQVVPPVAGLFEGALDEEMDHLDTSSATETRPERVLGEMCESSASRRTLGT